MRKFIVGDVVKLAEEDPSGYFKAGVHYDVVDVFYSQSPAGVQLVDIMTEHGIQTVRASALELVRAAERRD